MLHAILRPEESTLLCKRRPTLLPATHACAFGLPRVQQAGERAGRCATCVECAADEEPVRLEDVEVVVPLVVLAALQVGEKAQRVVVILGVRADLLAEGGVHEADVADVAVEEGEGGEALGVGEDRFGEDDPRIVLRPPLEEGAADYVQDALVRVVRRHDPRRIEDTCARQWEEAEHQSRARMCTRNAEAERAPNRDQGSMQ